MKIPLLFLAALGFAAFVQAQLPAASPTPVTPPPACVGEQFRQFDFWLGKWRVSNPQTGQVSGRSEITRVAEGCAIREQWTAARGTTGTSLNYFDSVDGEWHQDWVGGDGTVLHLRGHLVGPAMVLTGESKTANATALNRITWTPLGAGKVEQSWSISADKGQTWQISFVGIYEKQP